jgi:plasmid replication initiation protein
MSDACRMVWEDNERLRAEIERLTAALHERTIERDYHIRVSDQLADRIRDLRRWKAMDKPLTAAMAVVSNDMQGLKAQNTEAADFLDKMASYLDGTDLRWCKLKAAACRVMARKLRGSSYDAEMERQHGPDLIREK